MKKNNIAIWIGAIAVVAGAAWYLQPDAAPASAPVAAQGGGAKGAGPATVVNVVGARRQDVPVVMQANGTVTPLSSVDLHPQTTSTVRKVHIKEGQFVKAGQLLFTLDDRGDQANADKSRAQVARSAAALADLDRQVKRSEELVAQKFIAQSAVDTLRSQREAARAQLAADRAALQGENVAVSYGAIRAPMAGRVGAIDIFPGSLVQPATSLTTITQLDPITVAFALPESALGHLLAAQKSGAVKVEAGDAPGSATGTLSFIDNTVDAKTGTIRVKATFANRDTTLWPGQYVTARVAVRTLKDAVVIPQSAIISNTKGTFVYVVGDDKSAQTRPVTRLHGFGLDAAVTGLDGSEKIITDGKQNLRPGGKVRLADAPSGKGDGKADKPTKMAAR